MHFPYTEGVRIHGSIAAAAANAGLARETYRDRYRREIRQGSSGTEPVLNGFEISRTTAAYGKDGRLEREWVTQKPERGEAFDVPAGHVVKGVSALIDGEGRTLARWVKTREGVDLSAFLSDVQTYFSGFKPAAPRRPKPSRAFLDRQLALYPWADPHAGMKATKDETGEEWGLEKWAKVSLGAFNRVIAQTPQTKKAILLIGGDTLHAHSNENRTPHSGNALQVDGRYQNVLYSACKTIVTVVDLLMTNHAELEIIVLSGNHEMESAFAITYFLHAWYRNEPRVSVDLSSAPIRYRQFGKNMLAMTHGHETRNTQMPGVMASRQPTMWGETLFRYAHTFHVHHRSVGVSEEAGCIYETHQIIGPADAWHSAMPYTAGRSQKSIVYDYELGESGRSNINILPTDEVVTQPPVSDSG